MGDYCRLCTSVEKADELFNIFDPAHDITSKVLKLCQINILQFSYLPKNCCFSCLDTLNKFIAFIEKCLAAQETLKEAFNIKIEQNVPEAQPQRNVSDDEDAKFMCHNVVQINPLQNEIISPKCGKFQSTNYRSALKQKCAGLEIEIDPEQTTNEWLDERLIADDDIEDNDTFNNEDLDNYVIETLNSTAEITIESSSPTCAIPADSDKNTDGSINDESLAKLNLNTWKDYPWSCAECQIQCTSVTELREHYTIHKQTIKYHCTDCNKIYLKYLTFLNHVRRRHRPHLKLCCDICWKLFWHEGLYRKHRAMHGDDDMSHNCTICQKIFRSRNALHTHFKTHVTAKELDSSRCEICGKTFELPSSLLSHKRVHSVEKNFNCDHCGKNFTQKGNLESHLLTHMPLEPFSCSICDKKFKTQIRLNNHMSVHSGIKPHKCDICGRQFRERGTMREHLRIHTGELPFKCEFCDKRFRFKGILTTHRRQHTGERPYSCLDCNHHFTNWPNFNKHMKRRHNINTSVSTRGPQTIPPSGMPAQSKLNFVVPTVDNCVEPDEFEEFEEFEEIEEKGCIPKTPNDVDEDVGF